MVKDSLEYHVYTGLGLATISAIGFSYSLVYDEKGDAFKFLSLGVAGLVYATGACIIGMYKDSRPIPASSRTTPPESPLEKITKE